MNPVEIENENRDAILDDAVAWMKARKHPDWRDAVTVAALENGHIELGEAIFADIEAIFKPRIMHAGYTLDWLDIGPAEYALQRACLSALKSDEESVAERQPLADYIAKRHREILAFREQTAAAAEGRKREARGHLARAIMWSIAGTVTAAALIVLIFVDLSK